MASIQQLVFNAAKTKWSVFGNYVSGVLSSPVRIYINISLEDSQLLDYARESAMSKGTITESEQKIGVKGKLSFGSDVYNIKLSPTGLNLDMIGNGDKRAFKVEVLEGEKIFGMPEFKLLPPAARHNIVEWVGHGLELKEELIALRYYFIEVTLNGNNLGVYAIEEHFNKELLENRKAKDGIIFKEEANKIKVFNEKDYSTDTDKKNQIRLLRSAFQSVRSNDLEIDRIFNLEKYATHFAILDLMNGYHAQGINAFYYFNPENNLVEPITREYNSLRYSEGVPNPNKFTPEMFLGKQDYLFINKLFENDEFISFYLSKLMKLSDEEYLDEFFHEIDKEFNLQMSIIYREDPFYKFPKEYLYERQKQIRKWLNKDLDIVVNVNFDDTDTFNITARNNSLFPIRLVRIYSTDQRIQSMKNILIMPDEQLLIVVDSVPNVTVNDLNFSYKIDGIQNLEREAIIIPKSFDSGITLPNLLNSSRSID